MIKVAVIGCGLIGAQWDIFGENQSYPLTHAGAFNRRSDSRVVAFCDIDETKARLAARFWGGGNFYKDYNELFESESIDVAVISTSTSVRKPILQTALNAGVRHFVIEKPLANSLEEAKELLKIIEDNDAKVLVNYSRCWDSTMNLIRKKIRSDFFGTTQRLLGLYGKGIVNNGSHMISLVNYLFEAKPVRARCLSSDRLISDIEWTSEDLTLDAQVVFIDSEKKEFQLDLLRTDQSFFSCFELKIIGSNAVCDITEGGRSISTTEIVDDPNFQNYKIPGKAIPINPGYLESMDLMAKNMVDLLLGKTNKIASDGYSAIAVSVVVEALRNAALENNDSWITLELT